MMIRGIFRAWVSSFWPLASADWDHSLADACHVHVHEDAMRPLVDGWGITFRFGWDLSHNFVVFSEIRTHQHQFETKII
jgi:hypothetical protein